MNTWSHTIITAVMNHRIRKHEPDKAQESLLDKLPPINTKATIIGSFMPDLPLILISMGFIIYDRVQGVEFGFNNESATQYLFDTLFFTSPWIKFAHNLFHAPLMTFFYIALGYWAWKKGKKWGANLFWFGLACCLHSLIDIPLHYDDGPLLLFPFEWNLRFMSPVSYWDPARYGREFGLFELGLDIVLLIYLVFVWAKNRRTAWQNES